MNRISFIGDSYSDPIANGGVHSWCQVAAHHAALTMVATYAYPGEDTAAMIAKGLPAACRDRSQIVAVMTGANDWSDGVSLSEITRRLTEIVTRLRDARKTPVLVLPPPLAASVGEPAALAWEAYRRVIERVARMLGCAFSDAGDAIADPAAPIYRAEATNRDGSHFNGWGAYLIGAAAAGTLSRIAAGGAPADPRVSISDARWFEGPGVGVSRVVDGAWVFPGRVVSRLAFGAGDRGSLNWGSTTASARALATVEDGQRLRLSLPYRVVDSPGAVAPDPLAMLRLAIIGPGEGEWLHIEPVAYFAGDTGIWSLEWQAPQAGAYGFRIGRDLADSAPLVAHIGALTVEVAR